MTIKKIISSFLIVTMAFQLMACSSDTPPPSTEVADKPDIIGEETTTTDTTLSVAIWDKNQEPGMKEIMADFTTKTGIKVDVQVTPWEQYWTMLEAGATGGSLPDVFWMHTNEFQRYAEYEMLLDLTDNISQSNLVDLSKYPKDIVDIYTYDEKQYAVPKDIDTIGLWYNKTMFDEAGLSYPDDSWTWDDFRNACEKLTKDDGSQYGYAMKPTGGQETFFNTVYGFGGEIISEDKTKSGFDKPETIEAIKFMADLTLDGLTPAYEVMSENNPDVLFQSATVGMVSLGSWMIPAMCTNEYVIENGDLAVLPKDVDTGRRVSIYNGLGWAADVNTEFPNEAWQLIEYMGSQEAQQKQSDLGVVMSAYERTAENFINASPNFNIQAHIDMMDDMVIFPHSKSTIAWTEMSNPILVKIWTGAKDAETACKEIAKEMNAILAEE